MSSASLPSRTDFWGVELTSKNKEAVWDAEEEVDEPRDDPDIVHTLHIQRVILGPGTNNEDHLVKITAQNFAGEELTHPLCWLSRKSVSDSHCSMHMALPPPVTLKLAQGSGPVHIIGIWEQQLDEEVSYISDEGEDNEMDDMIDSMESKPLKDALKDEETKPKKRPATSPPTKPAKIAKKDEKVSKSVIPQLQKKPPIAEQDSDDEEEEEDEDDEGHEDDNDDDDIDDENEEESDEEEEEDEESEDEPPPPPKKKPQAKAITPKQKANTPKSIGDKAAKKPSKGATPQGSRSLDELKAMIAKSPNIPKKREKFNNYLQNNLKVTDPDVKNKLWNFVQQSKH